MELFDSTRPLVTYVGALTIFSFSLLWLLHGDDGNEDNSDTRSKVRFEPLLAALSALIALILVLDLRAVDFALSLVIAVIALAALVLVMYERKTGRWIVWAIIAFFMFGNTLLFWNNYQNNIYGVIIRAMLHSDVSSEPTTDELLTARWEQQAVAQFKEKFGATVEIERANPHVNERLKTVLNGLASSDGSTATNALQISDVDVFAIDVIWPGILTEYAEDLSPVFKNLNEFFDAIVKNNTVQDDTGRSKLVAVPWFIDTGLLFYRPTLLEKYGYSQPPETWAELEDMATEIQKGEQGIGKKDFWGFVWQGKAYEGLTCNALEWQFSHNGGTIVDTKNNVDITEGAVTAFKQAKNWIWTAQISPPDVTEYDEGQTLRTWLRGNAAFMRHWPYAYLASQNENSKVRGDVGVTLLPKGSGESGRHASILGGWQLMVNAQSKRKEKRAAIKFVEFLTSRDMQKSLAIEAGKLPSLKDLYDDPNVRNTLRFIEEDERLKPSSKDRLNQAIVRRPSTSTSEKYPEISEAYFNRIHLILEDKNNFKNAQEVVDGLRTDIQQILQ